MKGPHTWQCSDLNQSPINIIDEDVQRFPIRELLTWNHYDDLPRAIMMENNGHTGMMIYVNQKRGSQLQDGFCI